MRICVPVVRCTNCNRPSHAELVDDRHVCEVCRDYVVAGVARIARLFGRPQATAA